MALQQLDALQLGPFSPGVFGQVAQVFSSITPVTTWSNVVSYVTNQCVEFGGGVWRATASSTGQTPSATSTFWVLILPTVKDGDIALIVAGANSDINVRQNGAWTSVLGTPVSVSLANNTSGTVIALPLSVARAATLQYSIVNGSENQLGTLRYVSDGVGVTLSDYANVTQGGSPNISFSAMVSGSNVVLQYTSTDLNVTPATMKFTIQEWS